MTKHAARKHSTPSYRERTDRIRAWGEAAKNCTPLILRILLLVTAISVTYWGPPAALLMTATTWARPP
jgi:hypothetical protein